MEAERFIESVEKLGIDFYTGVPDSLLSPLCNTIYARYGVQGPKHVVAANEGGAVGLAAGHYLATGRPALVYMQNSGIGNTVNPVASLLNEKVYGIPCLFVVGWRGEPGVHDEPQHKFQGEITTELLELLDIRCFVLDKDTDVERANSYFAACGQLLSGGKSAALVIKKGALSSSVKPDYSNSNSLKRERALELILSASSEGDIFVSTTGKASRELFELREKRGEGHGHDFLTVGSMGHSSMVAMGIAMEKPERRVWCIDGDGAAVMHMGAMAVAAHSGCANLVHIVISNGAHETVGGMPVVQGRAELAAAARALGYASVFTADDEPSLQQALEAAMSAPGPRFIEIKAALGSRSDLGRPTTTPAMNKQALMETLL